MGRLVISEIVSFDELLNKQRVTREIVDVFK